LFLSYLTFLRENYFFGTRNGVGLEGKEGLRLNQILLRLTRIIPYFKLVILFGQNFLILYSNWGYSSDYLIGLFGLVVRRKASGLKTPKRPFFWDFFPAF